MTINEMNENREVLDMVEQVVLSDKRKELLRRLGHKAQGLRCWAFGLGWETRSVEEIQTSKIEEFAFKFA